MAFDFNIKKTLTDGLQYVVDQATTLAKTTIGIDAQETTSDAASSVADYFKEKLPTPKLIEAAAPSSNYGSSGLLSRSTAVAAETKAEISDFLGPLNTQLTVGDKTIAVGASSIESLGNDLYLVVYATKTEVIDSAGAVQASLTTPFGFNVTHDVKNNCVVLYSIYDDTLTVVNIANKGKKTISPPSYATDRLGLKFVGLINAGPDQWFIQTKGASGIGMYDALRSGSWDILASVSKRSIESMPADPSTPAELAAAIETNPDGRILFRNNKVFGYDEIIAYDHGDIISLPDGVQFTASGYSRQVRRPTITQADLDDLSGNITQANLKLQSFVEHLNREEQSILSPLWHNSMKTGSWREYDDAKKTYKRNRYDYDQTNARESARIQSMTDEYNQQLAIFNNERENGAPLITENYDMFGNLKY